MPRFVPEHRTWFSIVFAVTFGLALSLGTLTGLALAQAPTDAPTVPFAVPEIPSSAITSTQPLTTDFSFVDDITYARIITDVPVSVYRHPLDLERGLPPTRTIEPGFMFVSLEQKEPITFHNSSWYKINENEYVPANVITYYTASTFHGTQFTTQPDKPFGWIIRDTPIFTEPVNQPTPTDLLGWPVARKLATPDQPLIPRYTQVTIYETSYAGDWGWQRIGDHQWVHLYDVGKVEVMTRPTEIPAGEPWIFVNLFDQTMAVYDKNDQMIYATLVSTGRQVEGWRTPPGIYRIYRKLQTAPMAGGGKSDRYLLEDVTATMYFHEGYAFHAAYWHDDFGRYKSHGCVNMTPTDAEWLYNWSTPVASPLVNATRATEGNEGTWVWIYDPHE
ncbi:MAG TPA: L,D-transpeptidase [Anaerolineae bacterium]|nr:L,D-transpeptidase [Anaerolineae bacterium]